MFCFAVGLKLNLLDVTLSIDLQYLGVCLPIPPPIPLPEGSLGTCSTPGEQNKNLFYSCCQIIKTNLWTEVVLKVIIFFFPVHFISRTGKTTDITKIKGWREKFSTSSSSVPGGTSHYCVVIKLTRCHGYPVGLLGCESNPEVLSLFFCLVSTSSDTGQKNLSAFCSDMLDEYLESEGKLIDERAASFSQAVVTPVAYQLPTKSTSYVRTLDSVLKKQAIPLVTSVSKPSASSRKTALTSKTKEAGVKIKKSIKSSVKNPVSSTVKKSEGGSSNKSMKYKTSKSVTASAPGLSQNKKSHRIKTKTGSKTSQHSLQTTEKPVKDSMSVAPGGQKASSTPGSNLPVGRSSGLPKTLVKLRDVEDGAVWEGENRTYITMERAAIALSCLVTAEVCVMLRVALS